MIVFKLKEGLITFDSDDAGEVLTPTIEGDKDTIRSLINGKFGLRGHSVSLDATSASDVNAVLKSNDILYTVEQGQEILESYKLPKLPSNVKS